MTLAHVKAAVTRPVIASNRINTPDGAERILAAGSADLVSMARPLLADPDFAQKSRLGRPGEINTCIACNQACLDGIFTDRSATCLVNPRAGREIEFVPSPITRRKKLAVIGGGPAGMAFAINASGRGHYVSLFESAASLGGQLNLARAVPGRSEFNEMLRYFRTRLATFGVDVRLGADVMPSDFRGGGFDEIVVATGVRPRTPDIEGADHPKVLSYIDVLGGSSSVGNSVAIIGAGGVGFDVAEFLVGNAHGSSQTRTSLRRFCVRFAFVPDLLVRHACLLFRFGVRKSPCFSSLPAILGIDLGGTVEAVGSGVTDFVPGDEVYGMAGGVGGLQGTLAEYAAVDADLLAAKPANLSMREAAALPSVVITAWEGLVDRMAVGAGDTVLVQGGAGGVGHVAIQFARAFGAEVFATGSAHSRAVIERLGATFIERTEPVLDYVKRLTGGRGFHHVYDTVGGAALDASFQAVRRFGHVVSCLGWGTYALAPLSFKEATYSGVFILPPLLSGEGRKHHREILDQARRLIESGRLLPVLDERRFTLDNLCDAYRTIRAGAARGKLVVDIAS
jgi:NADPH2:quinone reductase